jgi:hypothetical protein
MRSSYDIFSAVHLEHISSELVCGGVAQCGDGAGDIFGQLERTAGITLACGFEDFFVAWNLPQRRAIGGAREDGIRRNAHLSLTGRYTQNPRLRVNERNGDCSTVNPGVL